jgi:hypothetical protein
LISEEELKSQFPKGYEYLRSKRDLLKNRKQYKEWYSFSAPRNLDDHDSAQMMVPLLANTGMFCQLPEKRMSHFCPMASGGFTLRLKNAADIEFVLGILNSRLMYWRLQAISNIFRGGWITCTKQYVGTLPIMVASPKEKRRIAIEQAVRTSVDRRIRLARAKAPQDRECIQREISTAESQIDQLVYELYGLTDREIALVEEATGAA